MGWFHDLPDRLAFELRELKNAGFAYEIDEPLRAAGQIVLTVRYMVGGVEHPLRTVYPTDYPHFPFQVFADTLDLPQHQDPYSKVLCFIANIGSEWDTSDTICSFLLDRFPKVLRANEGDPTVHEAREGAPATGYLRPQAGSLVVVAEGTLPRDCTRGTLAIGFEPGVDPNALLRGIVLEVRDPEGRVLGTADKTLAARIAGRYEGRWVRLAARPKSTDANKILEEAIAIWPVLRQPVLRGGPDIVGIVFEDDARYREKHDLWTFVVRRRDREVATKRRGQRLPPGDKYTIYLARSDRSSREDLVVRTPRLRFLGNKKAAIFGLGALGATVALQLARAGIGKLFLVDPDNVEAGNIPRWAMGWHAIGWPKHSVLTTYIQQQYPFVAVGSSNLKVGAVLLPEEQGLDQRILDHAFADAHLIIDCTVETTVHHYLSQRAWSKKLPYIWMSARAGGWGGIVGRAHAGKTPGCWKCFKYHQMDGRYRVPNEEEGADVQPVGCFSPTFTGAGFDLDEVSLTGVRLAVATLSSGTREGYADFDWDVGVVNLWEAGKPIAPDWECHSLEQHPKCDGHS